MSKIKTREVSERSIKKCVEMKVKFIVSTDDDVEEAEMLHALANDIESGIWPFSEDIDEGQFAIASMEITENKVTNIGA